MFSPLILGIAVNGLPWQSGTLRSTVDTDYPDRGFVNAPGAHLSWLTPNSNTVFLPIVYTYTVTLQSDGDVPVDITAVTARALRGAASVKSTTCIAQTAVGDTCSVTVIYDPTK